MNFPSLQRSLDGKKLENYISHPGLLSIQEDGF